MRGLVNRVLVTGDRKWDDARMIHVILQGLFEEHSVGYLTTTIEPFVVMSGLAKGADSIAKQWCQDSPLHGPLIKPEDYDYLTGWQPDVHAAPDECGVQFLGYPADWGHYKQGAGPVRNQQMLDEGHPTLVLAFHDSLQKDSKGTKDMVERADKAGVIIWHQRHVSVPQPILGVK
jgi:hypothetical protein